MPTPRLARKPLSVLASVAVAAALGAAVPASASAACAGASAHVSQSSTEALRGATLCLINRERAQRGLRGLRANRRLSVAADRHSKSMVARRFFAHGSFVSRIRRAGYLRSARSWTLGENIAWGSGARATPGAIVRAWMHSPPHRRNILGRFREIGIGVKAGAPVGGLRDAATYTTDFGNRR